MRIKNVILTIAAAIGLTFLVWAPMSTQVGAASPQEEVCKSINGTYTASTGECNTGGGTSVQKIIKNVLTLFSILIGIVAVLMIMVSGFKYITASGDANKLGSAKSTLTYALVGLVIAGLAQFIVQFVIQRTVK